MKNLTASRCLFGALAMAMLAAPTAAWDVAPANSQDGTPIPDVDKAVFNNPADNSCWQAAAANLLAAGDWGIGAGQQATAQARANRIYGQFNADFGTAACGNAGQSILSFGKANILVNT